MLVNTIQKKGYDFLDQKKKFFDDDYEYFLVQIKQLKVSKYFLQILHKLIRG